MYANNSWLIVKDRLETAEKQGLFGTGQGLVFGIQVPDMGGFLGVMVGWLVNKFGDIKLVIYLLIQELSLFISLLYF